jgi:hypothetical protein
MWDSFFGFGLGCAGGFGLCDGAWICDYVIHRVYAGSSSRREWMSTSTIRLKVLSEVYAVEEISYRLPRFHRYYFDPEYWYCFTYANAPQWLGSFLQWSMWWRNDTSILLRLLESPENARFGETCQECACKPLSLEHSHLVDHNPHTHHTPDEKAEYVRIINELNIPIRRSYKLRQFEDSAQKATGKKRRDGSEPEAGTCKLSAIHTSWYALRRKLN